MLKTSLIHVICLQLYHTSSHKLSKRPLQTQNDTMHMQYNESGLGNISFIHSFISLSSISLDGLNI